MAMNDPQELLKHELGDLLYAEKQILKALKPMIREASDPEMKARLEQHQGETEQQIGNLEQAFQAMGLKPKAQKCPGILGIIEEKKEFQEEEPSKPILEAFNLGAGLRVEHYEIAGYRSAMALAKSLRQTQVVDLLKANLEQEIAMAKFIEGASAKVLRMAQTTASEQANGGGRGGAKSARTSGGSSAGTRAGTSGRKSAGKRAAASEGATTAA